MEKGLNGFQTITNGCTFDINRIWHVIGNRKANAYKFMKTKEKGYYSSNNKLIKKPLGNGSFINTYTTNGYTGLIIGTTKYDLEKSHKWIEKEVLLHLKKIFPK